MLTLQLRQMERDGLLKRTVYHGSVIRTQYELTAHGRTLLHLRSSLQVPRLGGRISPVVMQAVYDP